MSSGDLSQQQVLASLVSFNKLLPSSCMCVCVSTKQLGTAWSLEEDYDSSVYKICVTVCITMLME